ncbi:MAG: RNA polymerase sigma-70 factor (ECF subfamily), partial [Limisphaerales bacterium]
MLNKSKYADDAELSHKMTRGDQQAFNEFFEHYYSRVYRYLCRRLNEADAEEVAMITIEQAIRRIETYRAEASL